jgi:uncharacterized membrane protein
MKRSPYVTWLVVFVLWMLGGFLVHGLMLQADYAHLPNLFRSAVDSPRYMPYNMLAHGLMAAALIWIYDRGRQARPWLAQGLRFGLAIALLTAVPTYLIYYAVQPMPGATVAKQILGDGAVLLVLGAVVAFMRRGPQAA